MEFTIHDLQPVERTTAQLEAHIGMVHDLTARGRGLSEQYAEVYKWLLELRYAERLPYSFGRIARALHVLDPGPLADHLEDAVAAGQLTDAERDTLLEADLVLSGRRREDQEPIYVLVEVSYGIGRSDVQRASDRARLLEKLGQPVVPAVAGRWIDSDTDRLARAYGVWQVLNGRAVPPAEPPSV
jgi:hypothetical protein